MKILHTSDWHLGKIIYEHSLLEDQEYALQQLVKIQQDDPHDVIVIAGDIYDRSLPSADAVIVFSSFLSSIREISKVPIVIIPGNHDSSTRLSYCADIISVSDIYIKTDPQKVAEPIIIENTKPLHIYAVPFLEPWVYNDHYNGQNSVYDVNEEQTRPTHEIAVAEAMQRIREKMDKSAYNVLVAHLFASGGAVSDSERVFIGTSGEVSSSLLTGFDYVALGHLHKPQSISETVQYSGSLLQYSFSEHNQKKQVLSVILSEAGTSVASCPVDPLRKLVKLKGTCHELLSDAEFASVEGDYIEAELSDDILVVNPLNQLKKRYPYILSVRQSGSETAEMTRTNEKERINEGSTIVDDFNNFYHYLYDKKPQQEVVELFNELHAGGQDR